MITNDIFTQIRFMDNDDNCYGKIEESENDGETFVFVPSDTHEVFPEIFKEANRLIEMLNKERNKNE